MKTLKRTTEKGVEFKRTRNEEAEALLKYDWQYCPKSEWKVGFRDVGNAEREAAVAERRERKKKKV